MRITSKASARAANGAEPSLHCPQRSCHLKVLLWNFQDPSRPIWPAILICLLLLSLRPFPAGNSRAELAINQKIDNMAKSSGYEGQKTHDSCGLKLREYGKMLRACLLNKTAISIHPGGTLSATPTFSKEKFCLPSRRAKYTNTILWPHRNLCFAVRSERHLATSSVDTRVVAPSHENLTWTRTSVPSARWRMKSTAGKLGLFGK